MPNIHLKLANMMTWNRTQGNPSKITYPKRKYKYCNL